MALRLYRLGRWCATHAKSVLAAWLVVLVLAGSGAAAFGRPLTNEVSVPGSEFEEVLDNLQTEIPDAAGGFGTVVLHTEDGAFTSEQRKAIDKVYGEWEDQPSVKRVINPFDNQRTLDDSRTDLTEAKKDLDKGQKDLDKAWVKISKAQGQLDYGNAWIDYFEKNDPDSPHLAEIRQQVKDCLLYTSPSPRDRTRSRMPSSA